jgi:SAM-dependent methyltransferase
MLARFGAVTGMEPDEQDRARAAARGVGVVQSGLLPDGLGDGTWDVILALDVIEHVAEDVASVKAMADRLAPGGLLVITVPAMPWLWSDHDVINGHVRRYTGRSLGAAFQKAGLKPDRISYFNTLLFPAVAGIRKLGMGTAGTATPPRPINGFLTQLMGFESRLLRLMNLPVGVSLLATYRAPA